MVLGLIGATRYVFNEWSLVHQFVIRLQAGLFLITYNIGIVVAAMKQVANHLPPFRTLSQVLPNCAILATRVRSESLLILPTADRCRLVLCLGLIYHKLALFCLNDGLVVLVCLHSCELFDGLAGRDCDFCARFCFAWTLQ